MTQPICVLGSYVFQMSAMLPHVPVLGETILARGFDMGQGGKGSNVAIAIRRLGAEVVLVERLGDDIFGEMGLEAYRNEGIATTHVFQSPGAQSGVGLVYIQPSGENTAAYYPGANSLLDAKDIEAASRDIARAGILYLQLEVPDEPILASVKIARAQGAKIVLNPAPARGIPPSLLAQVDVITPNQVEALAILGEPHSEILTNEQTVELGVKLLKLGPPEVYLTLGSKGAYYANQQGTSIFQKRLPVEVVDTVGAGDAFNGALCVALMEGCEPREALFRACVSGALTTTRLGVFDALPTSAEVARYTDALIEHSGTRQ